jgi:hypothetical protein
MITNIRYSTGKRSNIQQGISKFQVYVYSPKGQNIIARGNAPGKCDFIKIERPEGENIKNVVFL